MALRNTFGPSSRTGCSAWRPALVAGPGSERLLAAPPPVQWGPGQGRPLSQGLDRLRQDPQEQMANPRTGHANNTDTEDGDVFPPHIHSRHDVTETDRPQGTGTAARTRKNKEIRPRRSPAPQWKWAGREKRERRGGSVRTGRAARERARRLWVRARKHRRGGHVRGHWGHRRAS